MRTEITEKEKRKFLREASIKELKMVVDKIFDNAEDRKYLINGLEIFIEMLKRREVSP